MCHCRNFEVVRELLECGADPNAIADVQNKGGVKESVSPKDVALGTNIEIANLIAECEGLAIPWGAGAIMDPEENVDRRMGRGLGTCGVQKIM